jgi:branched-chain amino acid transport system substrate-binding protein
MGIRAFGSSLLAVAAAAALPTTVAAQTVKVGVILTYSGPQASLGEQIDKGIKLYAKLHEKDLPKGVKIDFVRRDDTGPNPDVAKRLATELVTRDRVQFLTGVVWTPNAAAMVPVATEAKVPFVIMNAAGVNLTVASPYVARVGHTLWQSSYPLGEWAAKQGMKKAYTAVTDYAPGHDGEAGFAKGFTTGGGEIVGSVRMPLQSPDFVPFIQRIKDTKPEVLYIFVPSGKQATAIMKAYGDLGLKDAGVKLVGPQDITTDEELPNMGDAPLGVITAGGYSEAADRPANKAFVAAWKKEYGQDSHPNFMAVYGWDGTAAIFDAVKAQNGKVDADKTMKFLSGWKFEQSPRGPIQIDPETRDIILTVYIDKVQKTPDGLRNVEIDKVENVKDPVKARMAK